MTKSRFRDQRLKKIHPFIIGAAGGVCAWLIQAPVPWLIGSLGAGLIASVLFRLNLKVPPAAQSGAQITIGLTVGLSFSLETLTSLGVHLPAVLGVLIATTALSLGMGALIARWTSVDRATGFLGTVPGAASAMVAAADQLGADARMVAVLQYVRLLFIIIVAPTAIAAWADRSSPIDPVSPSPIFDGVNQLESITPSPDIVMPAAETLGGALSEALSLLGPLALLALVGILGAASAARLKLPSPYVMGPMILATLLTTLTDWAPSMPPLIFNGALVVLGTWIGLRFNPDTIKSMKQVILVELVLLTGLLSASAALAYLLHIVTGIDLTTAILGNVPGALEAIIATAVDLGADAPTVAAIQTTRSFSLLCIGPVVVRLLQKRVLASKPETDGPH